MTAHPNGNATGRHGGTVALSTDRDASEGAKSPARLLHVHHHRQEPPPASERRSRPPPTAGSAPGPRSAPGPARAPPRRSRPLSSSTCADRPRAARARASAAPPACGPAARPPRATPRGSAATRIEIRWRYRGGAHGAKECRRILSPSARRSSARQRDGPRPGARRTQLTIVCAVGSNSRDNSAGESGPTKAKRL